MFRRRKKTDVDSKDKHEPGATWKELERSRHASVPVRTARILAPAVFGGVAGAFRYSGTAAAWGFALGAIVGLTMILIVRQLDVERANVALGATVVGAISGAPAAALLWLTLLAGFAPEAMTGALTGSVVLVALLAGFFGWLVGALAGGFAALVVWGFIEFFGG
jgi:hypothetical protein